MSLEVPSERLFLTLSADERIDLVRSSAEPQASLRDALALVVSLGRPRTCVVGMLTYALGAGHAGAALSTRTLTQAVLCFLGAFIANLENTYTDLEEDCRNLPGRVHALLRLGRRRLVRVVIGLHIAMLAAAASLDRQDFWFMLLALLLVHQYSFAPLRAKGRPLAGLFVFSLVVTYPFFVGLLADPRFTLAKRFFEPGALRLTADGAHFALLGGFVMFWFVAKGMFKNVPDYYGDRAAGLRTSATLFPSWSAAAVAAGAVTLLSYALFAAVVHDGSAPRRAGLALLVVPLVAWNCARLVRAKNAARGNEILRTDMIVSVAFVASVVALAHPTALSFVLLASGAFVFLLVDLLDLDSRRDRDVLPDADSASERRGS